MLGADVVEALSGMELRPLAHADLDICNREQVDSAVAEFRPDAIIHAAAFTQVDECERNPELGLKVNALGTRNVAQAAERADAAVVYISSDYVFDGTKATPYLEYDLPRPINQYGLSKLAGEEYVRTLCSRYAIVRTSWLFGRNGGNFVRKVLERAAQGEMLSVVSDQVGSPTYTRDLAEALRMILEARIYGAIHVTNSGSCSWFELARHVVGLAGQPQAAIRAIRSGDFPTATRRPANSRLANAVLRLEGLAPLRSWQQAVEDYVRVLGPLSRSA